jgi:hypothetical protein
VGEYGYCVCENEEFVHGKFIVMCSRMRALYVQLCENLAMYTHKGFENEPHVVLFFNYLLSMLFTVLTSSRHLSLS